ncbi:MAG: hypothetical protein GY841_02155, partial [FCB group bacterium]|nr:hypothetical protein [FCB group bacterium]
MFPSLESLYASARDSFFKLLRSFRKSRVRSAKGSKRRTSVSSQTTGRHVRIVKYVKGDGAIAPLQTIINAFSNGNYNRFERKVEITAQDIMSWRRVEYESLTLILLVDVSKSTWPFIKVFKEILRS